jgi:phosphate starvation-inducible protein PhoH
MLVYFTDAVTEQKIAINPTYVTAVFVAADGEMKGKTVIGLTNGSVVVKEGQLDTVGTLQAELK